MVESQPSKLLVAGSIPVSRSSLRRAEVLNAAAARQASHARRGPRVRHERRRADVAQLAERVLGKDEVTSSILVIGSSSSTAQVTTFHQHERAQNQWQKRNLIVRNRT